MTDTDYVVEFRKVIKDYEETLGVDPKLLKRLKPKSVLQNFEESQLLGYCNTVSVKLLENEDVKKLNVETLLDKLTEQRLLLDDVSDDETTPWGWLQKKQSVAMERFIIKQKDENDYTLLHVALQSNFATVLVPWLVKRDARICKSTENLESCLAMACDLEDYESISIFMKKLTDNHWTKFWGKYCSSKKSKKQDDSEKKTRLETFRKVFAIADVEEFWEKILPRINYSLVELRKSLCLQSETYRNGVKKGNCPWQPVVKYYVDYKDQIKNIIEESEVFGKYSDVFIPIILPILECLLPIDIEYGFKHFDEFQKEVRNSF